MSVRDQIRRTQPITGCDRLAQLANPLGCGVVRSVQEDVEHPGHLRMVSFASVRKTWQVLAVFSQKLAPL